MPKKSKKKQPEALSLFSILDDMVSVVDKNYRYVTVSKGYSNFFGKKRSDIIGKHVSDIHGENRFKAQIKPNLDRTLAGEEVRLQFWGENHKGQVRFIDSKHTPYKGRLTEDRAVAVVARDLTDLIKVQTELEDEKQLLNTLIDAIPDFIFTKDKRGRYQVCNASFEEFLGMNRTDIIGKTDYEIMSEESAKYITEKDNQVKHDKRPVRIDEWVTYKDGRRRLLDMYKLPLFDDRKRLTGLVGIGRNVTHERETEEKLLLSALVFESTSDPCLILSHQGELLESNTAAKRAFPIINNSSMSSIRITDLIYVPDADSGYFSELMRQQKSWQGEVCSTRHKHFVATLNAALGSFGEAEKFVLTLRDSQSISALDIDLRSKAYSDPLTGLPNRLLFMSRLDSALIRAERQRRKIALFFIDLNDFKPINDEHGHLEGDKLLKEVAHRLHKKFRETDTLARIGGDEFIAFIDITNKAQAKAAAEKAISALSAPFVIGPDDKPIMVSASIGVSIFPTHAGDAESLIALADEAMYKAKRSEKKQIKFTK